MLFSPLIPNCHPLPEHIEMLLACHMVLSSSAAMCYFHRAAVLWSQNALHAPLLYGQVLVTHHGQRFPTILRGETLSMMHLYTHGVKLEFEHAASCVHGTNQITMGSDTG